MDVDCIPFSQTGYFSKLITDYLEGNERLKPFCNGFAETDGLQSFLQQREKQFPSDHREILVQVLQKQYKDISCSGTLEANVRLLGSGNTFTVVTGHQLNLFTGPLFFFYKLLSAIKLCMSLKTAYPAYNFVPVYWMASEDHDFEEINHFTFKGKKLRWNRAAAGAVGRMDTSGLEALFETFSSEMGGGENAETLKMLFSQAYLKGRNLADATRFLVNELFGDYGLVVLDADVPELKKLLLPYIRKDVFENLPYQKVSGTVAALTEADEDYPIQVNPREINYFYLRDDLRERLVAKNGTFGVVNTKLVFSREELEAEMEAYPERFSPNVVTRPLYQEVILPNLCYIGGAGELSYWLELRAMFEAFDIPFPKLILRNSVLLIHAKQQQKLDKLQVGVKDLFLSQNNLINKKIREISNIDIDFSPQRKHLTAQFASLYDLAEKTDHSFLGAVKAQEVKQLKGLDRLEQRLLKAQKRKLQDQVSRLASIQNELFPGRGLQERQHNFSEYFLEMGDSFIPFLLDAMEPLPRDFLVLRY